MIAALQIKDVGLRAEIVRALGEMRYPESLGYLKYILETSSSSQMEEIARPQ